MYQTPENPDPRLAQIRQETQRQLESTNPGHTAAQGSIALAWQSLHDRLRHDPDLDLKDLNILSAVIHKLVGAFTQLKSIELKIHDNEIKQAEFESRKQQLEQAIRTAAKPQGLTPELLREIEQKLNLL